MYRQLPLCLTLPCGRAGSPREGQGYERRSRRLMLHSAARFLVVRTHRAVYIYRPAMTAGRMRVAHRHRSTAAICVGLTLVVLGLLLKSAHPAHFHASAGPGIYNGDCLLAVLATLRGTAPLPSAPTAATESTPGAALLLSTDADWYAPFIGYRDPRAPPRLT